MSLDHLEHKADDPMTPIATERSRGLQLAVGERDEAEHAVGGEAGTDHDYYGEILMLSG